MNDFLLYGATGFVGEEIARRAVETGLKPLLAGRDQTKLKKLAWELKQDFMAFSLDDPVKMEAAFNSVPLVLNCAGPFMYTYQPILEFCLKTTTHYLDITGELPVFQGLADLDGQARDQGIMLMPGVGFDVVPTDCLAVYLKDRLPSASQLTIAFQVVGPAGLPPGTQRTMIELIPYGNRVRRNGQLVKPRQAIKTREVDFGNGRVTATRITWGDVFTAYYSTGIPNIESYLVIPEYLHGKIRMMDRWRWLFTFPFIRNYLKRKVKPGPQTHTRTQTHTLVWGEVIDPENHKVSARLHGPEPGVEWTTLTALAAVKKVIEGKFIPGFQTPGKVFGADFVLEGQGVRREGPW
jgi:short subunit dehydrogenase-like uncharacterized protein